MRDGYFVPDKHARTTRHQSTNWNARFIQWTWEEPEQWTGNRPFFFLLPSPRLALRAKYRVRLAWLIKRLFCRLLWRGHSCSHCRRGYYDCCCSWSWDIYARIPEWVNTDETRGDEYSLKNRRGRLRPAVQPLTLLYTIFDRKGTPFIHLLLTNGTPFTYQVSNIASQLTAVSKTWINHKSRTFPRLFHSHKMHLLAPLGLN